MADLTITRFQTSPGGTLSHLLLADGTHLFGIEPPWRDAMEGVDYCAAGVAQRSCIPAGDYQLVPYLSPTRGQTWAFCGGAVSLLPGPGIQRTYCLIHPANKASELRGCLAPGRRWSTVDGVPFLESSRSAFEELVNRLGAGRHTARINWA